MSDNIQCGLCGNAATVHLTQIVNNKIHKVDLCEACAQKKGVTDPEGFSLADLLAKTNLSFQSNESQTSCPKCGHKTSDFRRTGRLGCAGCFEVFETILLPVLEDMHPGTQHKGKVPKQALRRQNSQEEISHLKDSLKRAIEEEAYEEAARIRDMINAVQASSDLEVSPQ